MMVKMKRMVVMVIKMLVMIKVIIIMRGIKKRLIAILKMMVIAVK